MNSWINEWMINTNTWKYNPVGGKETMWILSCWNWDDTSPIFCFIPYLCIFSFHNISFVSLSACLFHWILSSLRDSMHLAVSFPVSNIPDRRKLLSPLLVSSQRGAGMSIFPSKKSIGGTSNVSHSPPSPRLDCFLHWEVQGKKPHTLTSAPSASPFGLTALRTSVFCHCPGVSVRGRLESEDLYCPSSPGWVSLPHPGVKC